MSSSPPTDRELERRRFAGLRLARLHLRVGVMNELQYRANFVLQMIESVVALGTGLVVLALIFDRTDTLDGWTRPQLLVVMGVFTMVGGIIGFVIEPNMGRVMTDVRQGTFDYVLTKPVDSQLLSGVREFRVWRLTDVALGLVVLVWGVTGLDTSLRVVDALAFAASLAAGSTLVYCLWLIVTSGAFWFVRMNEVQELFKAGKITFDLAGQAGILAVYADPAKSSVAADAHAMLVPSVSGVSRSFGLPEAIGVPVSADNKDQAAKYLNWMMQPEVMVANYKSLGVLPTRLSVLASLGADGSLKEGDVLAAQAAVAEPLFAQGTPGWYSEFSSAVQTGLNAAAKGQISVADAMQQIADAAATAQQ